MKKLFAMFMAMAMMVTMTVTTFADGETETGSITINGISNQNTYEIYRLLDLESYDVSAGAYSYKANSAWAAFFGSDDAKKYFTTDADGYVTWTWEPTEQNVNDGYTKEDAIADFAKLALSHAKDTSIAPVKSSETDGAFVITGTSGTFSELPLGYYLVDSTVGALCGLTTTNPAASINAKNGIPTIDKQVEEDSTSQWGAQNTADIGQIVEYRATINVHAGAENYVLHDSMEDTLTFEHKTDKPAYPGVSGKEAVFRGVWKIEHVIPGQETHPVPTTKYSVVSGTDVVDAECTFEIRFTKEFCDSLETNDKVIVHYNAMLNRYADIANDDDGNINTAWLTFGEGNKSNLDSVTTYTYSADIVKTESSNKLIDGAQFKVYDAPSGGNEVAVVPLMEADDLTPVLDANGNPMYRRARPGEPGGPILVTDGLVTVVGFDNGTYYLEETEAPDGFNKLSGRQRFIISDGNLEATFNGTIYSTGSGVHVVNKTGAMLPETGGMGTAMFITCGSVLVLACGLLLVTKKRMNMIQD